MLIQTNWALYLSEKSTDEMIGFHVEGLLSEGDKQRFRSILEGAGAQFGKVRLLIAFEDLNWGDLEGIWEFLKQSISDSPLIEHIAFVGPEWVLDFIADQIEPEKEPEPGFFRRDEYTQAWDWLTIYRK
jgi:hypothetical protein